MGLLAAIPAALMGMLGTLGLGALMIGAFLAIWDSIGDGFKGWFKAESGEWGNIDKISGFIGGFFGGEGSGFWNAIKQGFKGALWGVTLGIPFGPAGMIVGGLIGLIIGGVAGWIGGQKIAKWVDSGVRTFRNLFDMPEALSPEQAKLAEMAKKEAQNNLMKLQMQQGAWLREMGMEETTYQRKVQLRKNLREGDKKIEVQKDIIAEESRRLAESQLGDMDNTIKAQRATTQEARLELQNATALKNQAYLKVIWARAIHGEGSEEHEEAKKEFTTAQQKVTDAKKWLTDSQAQLKTMNKDRSDLRTELDREHTTAMGNVRLFFKGEHDWQRNLKGNFTQMGKALGEWFKNNIYDPGGTQIHPDHPEKTKMRIFGVQLSWPKLSFPSWKEIKAALPWWLGGGGAEGGLTKLFTKHFDEWEWKLPSWEDAKKQMPKWLGGTVDAVEKAGKTIAAVAGVFGTAFDEWKLDVPSWEETKKVLPTWLGGTGSVGETVDKAFETFQNWEFKLPAWEGKGGIKELLPAWMGGGPAGSKSLLQQFKDEFDTETTWKFKIPSWDGVKALIPTWLGGTKGTSLAEQAKPMAEWTVTLPAWADIKKKLPWWLGGGDAAKTDAQKFEDRFGPGLKAWEFKLPTWTDIKKSLPKWLGGTKEGKTLSELAETTFGDWKIEFPTWEMIQEWLPDWITAPVAWIKGIFKKGEEASEEEQAKLHKKELTEGGKAQSAYGKRLGLSRDEALAEYKRVKEADETVSMELSRAAKEAAKWYATQATQMGIMTRGERIAGSKESKWNIDENNKAITAGMAAALQVKIKGGGGGPLQERQFTDDKDKEALGKMAKEAIDPSATSLYVHDTHLEKLTKDMWDRYFRRDIFKFERWDKPYQLHMAQVPAQLGALLSAAAAGSSGGGGGTTTINNITNAPSTSNSNSSTVISENTYGTVNPYVSVAGAYG